MDLQIQNMQIIIAHLQKLAPENSRRKFMIQAQIAHWQAELDKLNKMKLEQSESHPKYLSQPVQQSKDLLPQDSPVEPRAAGADAVSVVLVDPQPVEPQASEVDIVPVEVHVDLQPVDPQPIVVTPEVPVDSQPVVVTPEVPVDSQPQQVEVVHADPPDSPPEKFEHVGMLLPKHYRIVVKIEKYIADINIMKKIIREEKKVLKLAAALEVNVIQHRINGYESSLEKIRAEMRHMKKQLDE